MKSLSTHLQVKLVLMLHVNLISSKDFCIIREKISEMCSFLSHSSDINNLLEGLDGVLKDWLNGLHDTESSLHIIDLWLHALNGFHLSGNFNEWLSIIKSLKDSGGE